MLKLLKASIAALALSAQSALAAGTTPLALVPQVDTSGNVAAGCLLYFFQAGTVSTPQNAFADFSLTQALPNPVTCDQAGRVPMHWLADGLIHIRLTDSSGVVLVDTTMQTLGPSSGGGGGGSTVDPTTILSTGDEKVRYGTGPLSGFVRENGLTIGNATSGATERANSDTQALFQYLYGVDPNLVVSGGRTGNALNDFNAGKTIATPDMRGRANIALADMGNTATSLFTQAYAACNSNVTTLGAGCGLQNSVLLLANLPPYTPAGSITNGTITAGLNIQGYAPFNAGTGGSGGVTPDPINPTFTQAASSFTGTPQGGSSTPFAVIPPAMLKTFYIKL